MAPTEHPAPAPDGAVDDGTVRQPVPDGVTNSGRTYVHHVRQTEARRGLVELLATAYSHSSAAQWTDHIAAGRITVDGSTATLCQKDEPLAQGTVLQYHRPPWVEPAAPVEALHVLHDDGALVVCAKPAGLPVLPSEIYYEHTVLAALRRKYGDGPQVPHPVHRLGVGTSGVLLCAVGADMRAALSRAFEGRLVQKTYRALASGIIRRQKRKDRADYSDDMATADNEHRQLLSAAPIEAKRPGGGAGGNAGDGASGAGGHTEAEVLPSVEVEKTPSGAEEEAFEVSCPIGPVPHCSWGGSVHGAMPQGGRGAKPATSYVRVLRRDAARDCTLVEVRIPTGRAHQIRIHMAHIGHPLCGDPLYVAGGRPKDADELAPGQRPPLPRDDGYLLHAWSTTLRHPVTGQEMSFSAPPPPELM